MAIIPAAAYALLVKGKVVKVPLDQIEDRVVTTAVVPCPPGIPLLMPGERTGTADGPVIGFLKALQEFDARFPGFGPRDSWRGAGERALPDILHQHGC